MALYYTAVAVLHQRRPLARLSDVRVVCLPGSGWSSRSTTGWLYKQETTATSFFMIFLWSTSRWWWWWRSVPAEGRKKNFHLFLPSIKFDGPSIYTYTPFTWTGRPKQGGIKFKRKKKHYHITHPLPLFLPVYERPFACRWLPTRPAGRKEGEEEKKNF